MQPLVTVAVLVLFIVYSTFRAFQNAHYFSDPYISPFYSPCLTTACEGDTFPELWTGPSWISPALYILVFPLGFRLTCYYYRKAYYRSFWLSPPACAVAEPHKRYTGETRLPLIGQNVHRYFFYSALVFNVILTYDACSPSAIQNGAWGHMGLGRWCCSQRHAALAVHAVVPLLPAHRRRAAEPLLPAPAALPVLDRVSRLNDRHMQSPGSRCSASRSPTSTSAGATGVISDLDAFFDGAR